jgi:hypothetical protein
MKTDKVVSFDKLGFKIFSLGYKSGTGLPKFIKNEQNYNLCDKRTTKNRRMFLLRKKRLT